MPPPPHQAVGAPWWGGSGAGPGVGLGLEAGPAVGQQGGIRVWVRRLAELGWVECGAVGWVGSGTVGWAGGGLTTSSVPHVILD